MFVNPAALGRRRRQCPFAGRLEGVQIAARIPLDQAGAVQRLQPPAGGGVLADRHQAEAARPERPVRVGLAHRRSGEFPAFGTKAHLESGQVGPVPDRQRMVAAGVETLAVAPPEKIDLPLTVRRQAQLGTQEEDLWLGLLDERRRERKIRLHFAKKPHQFVSIDEFCLFTGLAIEQVTPFLE